MKSSSLSKIALLGCMLGIASFTYVSADDAAPATTPPTDKSTCQACHEHHGFGAGLTDDEKAELKKDWEQVSAANPDFKTEGKALWEQRKTLKDATPDDKKAFFAKWHAYEDKLNAAIVAADPNAAPLIAKVKAAFHHHHHHDGDTDDSADSTNP